jgi:hypothetical protein
VPVVAPDHLLSLINRFRGDQVLRRPEPGVAAASRLATILPPLDSREMLEVSTVHSLAGELMGGTLRTERPFRAPHHSASMAALVGGGSPPAR